MFDKGMARVIVEVGQTPEKEFEEVAERAYKRIGNIDALLEYAHTEQELIDILEDKYFHDKGYPGLLQNLPAAFKRLNLWNPSEEEDVQVEFPEPSALEQVFEVEKGVPVKKGTRVETEIDIEKYKTIKSKRVPPPEHKVKFRKNISDEEQRQYFDEARSKEYSGYSITKSGRIMSSRSFEANHKNLLKANASRALKKHNKQVKL
jgi:hypothetical protein